MRACSVPTAFVESLPSPCSLDHGRGRFNRIPGHLQDVLDWVITSPNVPLTMSNERLRCALAARALTVVTLAARAGVDPKTAQRWLAGRTPHTRHRWAITALG